MRLPHGRAANCIRGALGLALHQTATPETYARLFHPTASPGPSGLADPPRPFVLRCALLEGLDAPAGAEFAFDLHLFDLADHAFSQFTQALEAWQKLGLGRERARVRLERVEAPPPRHLSLGPGAPMEKLTIQFVTPTELKSEGDIVSQPEFPILFARVRDRVATLAALYGSEPLECDFTGLGRRATAIRMTRSEIQHQDRRRRSASTGLRHPLGGFTGEADYAGPLTEFAPWLMAAQFTGVGRQTVWGKGELRVRAQMLS